MSVTLTDIILSEDDQKRFASVYEAFTNNGIAMREDKVERLELEDLLSTPDATRFIPKVVETVVREALEPNLLVVPSVFDEIRLEAGRSIQIGAVGALQAAEIPEGGEYPERQPSLDGGDMVAITISKKGLMIRVTDEMISDSQWDVIGLWLRQAGRALARLKELKALNRRLSSLRFEAREVKEIKHVTAITSEEDKKLPSFIRDNPWVEILEKRCREI